jgi:hypothetical protein
LLKLSRDEVYDMLRSKNRGKLGLAELGLGAILTLLRVTGTIAIAQPLLNFVDKDPTLKMSI